MGAALQARHVTYGEIYSVNAPFGFLRTLDGGLLGTGQALGFLIERGYEERFRRSNRERMLLVNACLRCTFASVAIFTNIRALELAPQKLSSVHPVPT